jgi:excinuclease ABC subunit A
MLKEPAGSVIRLRGVRHNNLKNFDLDLPLNRLIVITGLSGSGKSSLAFDTLYAEGQRRYIETFSPYARQFFDRMDKPQVDSIEGIPPAIAIEQRNAVKTTRSTVGTMTEICDYMKLLWPHLSRLHCRQCGQPVRKDSPQSIWEATLDHAQSGAPGEDRDALITFDLPASAKLSLDESLALIARQGYQRLLRDGRVLRIDNALKDAALRDSVANGHQSCGPPPALTVVQDRIAVSTAQRARFIEACEQALHFGKGKLAVWRLAGKTDAGLRTQDRSFFSNRLHCAQCDLDYREPSAALFSFNHPVGACPKCKGFGRIISIDYDLALPDRSRTLAQGVVRPWLTGHGLESQNDLMRACRQLDIPVNVPFSQLPAKWQRFVIEGDPDYGTDEEHEWPRAWYGVKGYFRWLESKAYKMHVRVLLSRYRAYTPCPDCGGSRLQPEALLYRLKPDKLESPPASTPQGGKMPTVREMTLADFYQLPVRDARKLMARIAERKGFGASDPLGLALREVQSRLGYLDEAGLGYLTLDRPTRSLSGGETERVNLTTCLGTHLVNTLFVLDEPSVGLHPRDTARLVRILRQLCHAGNTVVVVEHESLVMRAADQIVDLGPRHGATGGEVVFQGSFRDILKSRRSLTGQYLSGARQMEARSRRSSKVPSVSYSRPSPTAGDSANHVLNDALPEIMGGPETQGVLRLSHATRHNLRDLSVTIPLNRLVCVTGVSGSGKTTLLREVLLPALESQLKSAGGNAPVPANKASERMGDYEEGERESNSGESASAGVISASLEGWEPLSKVVLVDQAILGKTPRSNPAVYIGAFDDIREVFADSEVARQHGLNASAFSFNSAQGQCERCRGAGFEKIEMQFLSDVFVRCPDCGGRRYRSHILEARIRGGAAVKKSRAAARTWSIADVLDATVDEVIEFLSGFPESRHARRAAENLGLLCDLGLGYLRLGQPINTLSGGESQRLKLVRHLAEAGTSPSPPSLSVTADRRTGSSTSLSAAGRLGSTAQSPRRLASVGPESRPTLFLFDEPTTGLHFDDVRILLKVLQRLVDSGHSVIVIEHNLDVMKSSDWLVDLGPGAGDEGGTVVDEGTPEDVASRALGYTGKALREILPVPGTALSV